MDQVGETERCSNCSVEVLHSNYITHVAHCQRYFYLCPKCLQPARRCQRRDHDNENHAIIQCPECSLPLEKWRYNNHTEYECTHRNINCSICDTHVRAFELAEHEDYCGSRTEECEHCHKFVMLKCKSIHIESGHQIFCLPNESGPSMLWRNGRRQLGDFMPVTAGQKQRCKKKIGKKSGNI